MLIVTRFVAPASTRIPKDDALIASVSNKIVSLLLSPHKHKLSSLLMLFTLVCAIWELVLMADRVR